jgi:hypothetical protein
MTARLRFWFTICLVTGSSCAFGQQSDDEQRLLQVEANAYRANLESFEFMTCRYKIVYGFAASLDDALAQRFEPDTTEATVAYFKDGPISRFQLDVDAKTNDKLSKPLEAGKLADLGGMKVGRPVPFVPTGSLLNGKDALKYLSHVNSASIYDANITRGKQIDTLFILSPLAVNSVHDFGLLADRAIRKEIRFSLAPRKDGRAETTFTDAQDPVTIFTTDPTRGSLPTRLQFRFASDPNNRSAIVVPEIMACSKGRWFPKRVVTFSQQSPTQTRCLVLDYRVLELDVDRRPPREAFTLDLPAKTSVCQADDPQKFFITRQPEHVGPDDLARVRQLTEGVPVTPQMDTTIVVPPRRDWIWYAVAGGAAFVLAAAYFARRHRRTRGSHVEP